MTHQEGTTVDQMFKAGAHFGFSRSRRHPSAKQFVFGVKNRVEIIDLEKTADHLSKAKDAARELSLAGKQILFIGTKPEARAHMLQAAQSAGMPYVSERWIGGLLTNFHEMKKRVARLEDLLGRKEKGELAVYTKKERLMFDREIASLERKFGGVVSLAELPKALFIVDPRHEKTAVNEALQMNIPIIALASTDCNTGNILYPIPGNDATAASISFFTTEIARAIQEGKSSARTEEVVENVKE